MSESRRTAASTVACPRTPPLEEEDVLERGDEVTVEHVRRSLNGTTRQAAVSRRGPDRAQGEDDREERREHERVLGRRLA